MVVTDDAVQQEAKFSIFNLLLSMINLLKTYAQAGKQAATVGASLEATTAFNFCISILYEINRPDNADWEQIQLPGLYALRRAALLACSAFDLVVASRFERLLNSCVISPSISPVRAGATAALPLESASVNVASAAVLAPTTGVAPENLHVLHAGDESYPSCCQNFTKYFL